MFADRLKELRKKNGYTQVTLAEELGVSKGTVAMWETGKRTPDFEKLDMIASLFDVRLDYLMGRSDDDSSATRTEEEINEIALIDIAEAQDEIFRMYVSLDNYGKAAVDALVRVERLRCLEQGTLIQTSGRRSLIEHTNVM